MTPRRTAISAIFLVLLIVSVGLKVEIGNKAIAPDELRFAKELSEKLSYYGFSTEKVEHPIFELTKATQGKCQMVIGYIPPGNHRIALFRVITEDIGPVVFVSDGKIAKNEINSMNFVEDQFQRRLAFVGIRYARKAPIAIASSSTCQLQDIDWQKIVIHTKIIRRKLPHS